LAAYQQASADTVARRTAVEHAQNELAAVVDASRSPIAAVDPATGAAAGDLTGANVVLAAARQQLASHQQLVDRLAQSIAAAETAQTTLAASEAAAREALAKIEDGWTRRCLAGGIAQLSPEQMAWSVWQALGVLDPQARRREWTLLRPSTAPPRRPRRLPPGTRRTKVYDNCVGTS
jgi:3-oxoacyl-(acyl-carrier-protein) synthase